MNINKVICDYIAARDAHPYHVARLAREAQIAAEFAATLTSVAQRNAAARSGLTAEQYEAELREHYADVADDCRREDLRDRHEWAEARRGGGWGHE